MALTIVSMLERSGALILLVLGCCARVLAQDSSSNDEGTAPLVALLTPIVALARDGTEDEKAQAARKLAILARDDDNQVAIAEAGGIAPLAALARGTDEQETFAAAALAHLALSADNQVAITQAGGITPLVALLLVALARDGADEQKTKAAGALANLSFDNADNQVAIVEASGIEPLVALVPATGPMHKSRSPLTRCGTSRLRVTTTRWRSHRPLASPRSWRWPSTERTNRRRQPLARYGTLPPMPTTSWRFHRPAASRRS